MAKGKARYIVLFGLTGCMPNTNDVIECTTRRELLAFIRDELRRVEFPLVTFNRETRGIKAIWRHIAEHGSSSAHFSMHHKGYALEFCGMTDAEYAERLAQDDMEG